MEPEQRLHYRDQYSKLIDCISLRSVSALPAAFRHSRLPPHAEGMDPEDANRLKTRDFR